MASISFKNVTKIYDGADKPVVPNLNLEIKDKEFIILVGPSGCGKSTTLRMIAGLESISSGELYIGDRLVNQVPPKDRDIAMVFQNYALYPHMTVYKNIAFGLTLRNVPKDEIDKRVHEAAKILDLEHLLERKPKALSGGQRQRVAAVPWSATPRSSSLTSLCPTWTQSCVPPCAVRSPACTAAWTPPSSTSPTTRPRL